MKRSTALTCLWLLLAVGALAASPCAALAADVDPPVLVSSEPAGGAALAAPPATLVLHYSEPLDAAVAPTASLTGGPPVTAAVQGSDVVVTPQGFFLPHSSCTLTVDNVADPAGNHAAEVVISFTVERVPAVVRLSATRTVMTYGGEARLRGRVNIVSPLMALDRMFAGEPDFSPLAQVQAAADGAFSWVITPKASVTYRVTSPETADLLATRAEAHVDVRPRLIFEVPQVTWKGARVALRGQAKPGHPGAVVTIQRKYGTEWRDWRQVTLNSRSRFSTRWRARHKGTYRFRLKMAADTEHLANTTAVRIIKVAPPNPHNISPLYRHFIVVDLSECHLYYYERGVVLRRFDCVVGKPSTPTPVGQWTVYQKVVGMWGAYGPYTMWYHYPYHFGIHGTNEPWLLSRFPRYYSHGCTRLANRNISWLFPRVPVGTPVRNVR